MIEPNFYILLWIVFISMALKGMVQIIAGCMGMKRAIDSERYGRIDIIAGIISLIFVIYVILS